MSTPATTPQAPTAPGQDSGASPASPGASPQGGGTGPLQIIAAMTRLSQMLAQALPAAAPYTEEIAKQLSQVAQKAMAGQQPTSSPGAY